MKIAIPLAQKNLCMHFGHCQEFGIYSIEGKDITKTEYMTPPPHEPGVYPVWLSEMNVEIIIAGGMGSNAQALFANNNIKVVTGATGSTPEEIITNYLNDQLVCGANACDH